MFSIFPSRPFVFLPREELKRVRHDGPRVVQGQRRTCVCAVTLLLLRKKKKNYPGNSWNQTRRMNELSPNASNGFSDCYLRLLSQTAVSNEQKRKTLTHSVICLDTEINRPLPTFFVYLPLYKSH